MLRLIGVCLALYAFSAEAFLSADREEIRYNDFSTSISRQDESDIVTIDSDEQKLLVDAMWDAQEEGKTDIKQLLARVPSSDTFTLAEQLRLAVIAFRAGEVQDLNPLTTALITGLQEDENLATLILSLRLELQEMGLEALITSAQERYPETYDWVNTLEEPAGDQTATALDLWSHRNSAEGVRLFMFCRSNRAYPCMLTLRNKNFEPVRRADGLLWMQPSLGMSARSLPSHKRNGHTPAGVWRIQGVMPAANQQLVYGKFRRIILNFIPASAGEAATKALLPASSQEAKWWRPATVARNVGRNMFRMHGTGRKDSEVGAPWFPFKRTLGCVAQRENSYNGIAYKDQRSLLDTLMKAQGLAVRATSETSLRGLLYVIDINDEARAVTRADLVNMGVQ